MKYVLYYRKFKARRLAKKTQIEVIRAYRATGQEARETQQMAKSFFQLLESKLDIKNRKEPPTHDEIQVAINQLKDVGRFSVLTALFVLPGGSLSIIVVEYVARKLGVNNFTLLPSAFQRKKKK